MAKLNFGNVNDPTSPGEKPTEEQEKLIAKLRRRTLPPHLARRLEDVVLRSWRNYESFYARQLACEPKDPRDARMLQRLRDVGLLLPPRWFVETWVVAIGEECRWRTRDPSKWAAFRPRHETFSRLGREAAQAFCCDPDRFDRLLEEVLR